MNSLLSALAFGMPGTHEWLIILVVVVVVFGATKIPALGSAIGKGIGNFRKGMRELKDEEEAETKALEDKAKSLEEQSRSSQKSDKDDIAAAN